LFETLVDILQDELEERKMNIIHWFLALLLAAIAASAATPQRQVIISYADNTPSSVIDEAKKAIVEAVSCSASSLEARMLTLTLPQGGVIEHEFNLIKGFVCKAPAKVLNSVKSRGSQYKAVIEDDQVMSISNS
jgi:hypothetical protein